MIDACREIVGESRKNNEAIAREVGQERDAFINMWAHKLTDNSRPISPYRVIWDFMRTVPPEEAIVTHDSGSPRDQIVPFYRSNGPRTYLGWGKSHGLGTGLGLVIGAKLAQPDKVCVNFMGDAAFGMVGLDFETAVRSNIPIITVVLNNSHMAAEVSAMADSHRLYNTRDLAATTPTWAGPWADTPSASKTPMRCPPPSPAPAASPSRRAGPYCWSSSPALRRRRLTVGLSKSNYLNQDSQD